MKKPSAKDAMPKLSRQITAESIPISSEVIDKNFNVIGTSAPLVDGSSYALIVGLSDIVPANYEDDQVGIDATVIDAAVTATSDTAIFPDPEVHDALITVSKQTIRIGRGLTVHPFTAQGKGKSITITVNMEVHLDANSTPNTTKKHSTKIAQTRKVV